MYKDFLQGHKDSLERLGFWEEEYRATFISLSESTYKIEILKKWGISDVIMNGDKVLIKWFKRPFELDNEQLMNKYGRTKD